uniref:TMEM132D_N domain-containing protein n=1 Tax=Panagrellus redivivus TaxID=6233 RepID=A0A7E4ZS58_PANRE
MPAIPSTHIGLPPGMILYLPSLSTVVLGSMVLFAVLLVSLLIVSCISKKRDTSTQSAPPPVVTKTYKPTNADWRFWSARCDTSTAGQEVRPLRNLSEESDMSRSMVVTRSSDDIFTSRSGNHSYA